MGEVLVQLLSELEQHRLELPLPLLPVSFYLFGIGLGPTTPWALLALDLVQLFLLLGYVFGSGYVG